MLGSAMLDNSLLDEVMAVLSPPDFYVKAHRLACECMVRLTGVGVEIDPLLMAEDLRREGLLEQVGGMQFLSELTHGLPHYSNIERYVKVIKDHSVMRQLINTAAAINTEAHTCEGGVDATLDRAAGLLHKLSERRARRQFKSAGQLLEANLQRAEHASRSGNPLTGLATGLNELDSQTLGLQRSNLIIVAARPSVGKTSLGLTVAQNAAFDAEAVVAFFSLEMGESEIGDRILSSDARVDAMRLRSGYLSRDEWERLREATSRRAKAHLYVDDTPGVSPLYVRTASRRLAAQHGRLDLIVVDYLQLMSSTQRQESRQLEVSAISRELKATAKELNVPLIAMSQLSRAPEQRSDHRPQLSDLRESGTIEQDSDLVAFIFREEMYNRTEENAGVAEIIIAKNRSGPTGTVKAAYLKEFTRFQNLWRD